MKRILKYEYAKPLFVLLLILGFIMLANSAAAQCAMCRANAESSIKNNTNSIARGLNMGILYLMAIPYLMLAFIFRAQLKMIWKNYGPTRFKKQI